MKPELLLGDEAIALAAIDAGIAGAFSYPGTPATEVFEAVHYLAQRGENVWNMWSTNEKVAYEEALGMSYAGKRALVSMKHVGLNVAADPFVNSALTGVNGGLVLLVADDPGMHSSQNEQDSRFYADFAKVPLFEPANQQEAYDMTREAFNLSEEQGVPVVLRITTRLAHSRANVLPWEENQRNLRDEPKPLPNPDDWTLVPANARRRFKRLLSIQPDLQEVSRRSRHNTLKLKGKRGIITSGIAYNYVREALAGSEEDSILRVGMYPLPVDLFRDLVGHCDEILVIEEGYPFIEQKLNGLLGLPGKSVRGKLNGFLPPDGELTPEMVAAALGSPIATRAPIDDLVGRPPQLCRGCPHADSFKALLDSTEGHDHRLLFSDIGCYTLGAMHPYKAVDSTVDMGASITMAFGAAQAGAFPVLCTIGDSTFSHSGITGLMDAVRADANMTVMILDNSTVAMTGAQDTAATGDDLLNVLRGIGVKDLQVIDPLRRNHPDNVAALKRAIDHKGLSVIVAQRPCIQLKPTKPAAATCATCGEDLTQPAPAEGESYGA